MLSKSFPFIFCGFSLLFVALSCKDNTSALLSKPNVLFIAVDDLRPELGCYGVDYVKSPNIDKLGANGIVFQQAYCQSAVCNPSRVSLMTGLRPSSTKIEDLNTNFRNIIPEAVTIPQYLRHKGYHTVAIGKIFHNIFPDSLSWSEPKMYVPDFPFDPDAIYRGAESIAYQEARKRKIIEAGQEKRYIDQFGKWYLKAHATECEDLKDDEYYDGAQTDLALMKLEELANGDEPFFFGVGYYRPHLPFNAPKQYWDLYSRDEIPLAKYNLPPVNAPRMALNNLRELRGYVDFKDIKHPMDGQVSDADARKLKHGYLASVSYIDAQVGRLVDKLDELELLDNTIIVLWGDHGWKLGEKGSWCKMTNYGIDTRVPLIVSTPELRNKGKTSDGLVELIDIFPSLCELVGLSIPENLDGKSFVQLLHNPTIQFKTEVYSQFYREGIWTAPDSVNYNGYSVRNEKYLYVEWYDESSKKKVATELYDLINDPSETKNVAEHEGYSSLIQDLETLLHRNN